MKKAITGVMIYYYKVCHRKLWYFYHEIQMEQDNQNVQIGRVLDENTYKREDKYINIDNVINVDFIRTKGVLHEVKKSKKIEHASILQMKYYLYYMNKKGVTHLTGKIDYPLVKESVDVVLTEDDITMIETILIDIEKIVAEPVPSPLNKKNICKSCAYFDLCYI